MKIPHPLIQFENPKSLIIVAGEKSGIIHLAFSGQLNKMDVVEFLDPKYSDREGFFMNRGAFKTMWSGSSLEKKKNYVEKKFSKKLEAKIDLIASKNNVQCIYLFCPDFMYNFIIAQFPDNLRSRLGMCFLGNFLHTHPTELLQKIMEGGNLAETTKIAGKGERCAK